MLRLLRLRRGRFSATCSGPTSCSRRFRCLQNQVHWLLVLHATNRHIYRYRRQRILRFSKGRVVQFLFNGHRRCGLEIYRKNHLTFEVTPFDRTKSFVAVRNISFQGQSFIVGTSISANLKANGYAPGYMYDIIRRKRGHLAIKAQFNIFDVLGSLDAGAQVVNGTPVLAHRAQGTIRAPIPVFGPDVRFYLTKNSNRLFVTGNILGMYFFGYGNFISTFDTVGLSATKHLKIRAGYQLGSRLNVNNNAATRIGISLTQKGPVVGIEVPF